MSFSLGRPLGNPGDPDFQKDVIKHAFALFERSSGPVLEDYPYDADEGNTTSTVPACPVDFSVRQDNLTDIGKLLKHFQAEFSAIHSWHTIAQHQSQRTTTGISGLTPDSITRLFSDFIQRNHDCPSNGKLADLLRHGAEDLKAFYFEALSAQPDQPTDDKTLSNWFWGTTCAAGIINEVRKSCLKYEDKEMLLTGKLLLVPRNQLHRFE